MTKYSLHTVLTISACYPPPKMLDDSCKIMSQNVTRFELATFCIAKLWLTVESSMPETYSIAGGPTKPVSGKTVILTGT